MDSINKSFLRISVVYFAATLFHLEIVNSCELLPHVLPCSQYETQKCKEESLQEFSKYKQSQLSCGVTQDSLPYILEPENKENIKGTIVLVHGLRVNPSVMRPYAEQFAKSGYNVVVPILSGHGGADLRNASEKSWKDEISFAADIAAKLAQPVLLAGHSTGGALVTREALEHPEKYKGVILWDPAINLEGVLGRNSGLTCPAASFINYLDELETLNCYLKSPMKIEKLRNLRELQEIANKLCGHEVKIPQVSDRISLNSICALYEIIQEITNKERAPSLDPKNRHSKNENTISPLRFPPSITFLSADQSFKSTMDENKLKFFLNKVTIDNPSKSQIIHTNDTHHGFMINPCSEGFQSSSVKIQNWLKML